MISVLGIAGWVVGALFFGWVGGVFNVQFWDDLNYRRDLRDQRERDVVLAEGRANQAAEVTS